MLSIIFWVLMIIVATILLITDIDHLIANRKLHKLQKEIYKAKLDTIVSQAVLNIAKANKIVKEDK